MLEVIKICLTFNCTVLGLHNSPLVKGIYNPSRKKGKLNTWHNDLANQASRPQYGGDKTCASPTQSKFLPWPAKNLLIRQANLVVN